MYSARGEGSVVQAGAAGHSIEAAVASDAAVWAKLQAAGEAGLSLFRVVVVIDTDASWAAVRLFQVLNELALRGEIVISVPSAQEIKEGEAGNELQAVVASLQTGDELRRSIEAIAEVRSVRIEPWRDVYEDGVAPGWAQVHDTRQGQVDAFGRFRGGLPPEGWEDQRIIDLGPEARGKSHREQLKMAAEKIETLQTRRIDVEQLDALTSLVGELAINRTQLSQISSAVQSRYQGDELVQALANTSAQIVKAVGELYESIVRVRALPVGWLFSTFPRLVRYLARSSGKSIDFVVEGEEVEFDRLAIDGIRKPLVRLIRNAVERGIEPPAVRRAAGKPESGHIRLSAREDHDYIVITLEDDGAGIDAQGVRESAVQKGIISAQAAERLSDVESLRLIFEPGVWTTEETAEISGQDVDMEGVRREIEALSGRLEVDSSVGVGTRFTLRLPLPLAHLRGLFGESAKEM
ncbi:MAG: ATP-binding protein [Dehalococcoidia bacterium]